MYIYIYIYIYIYNIYTTYIYIYIYIYYVIMKTICALGYHHNGFVETDALGHMMHLDTYYALLALCVS